MNVLGLVELPGWVLAVVAFLLIAYLYGTWTFGAFRGTGLQGPKPYPFLGTMWLTFMQGLTSDIDVMQKYGQYVAMFMGRLPVIFTSDVDLIKTVCIKEFSNFVNRMPIGLADNVTSDMLSLSSGEKWRRLRHLMSPSFSTGKVKKMLGQMNKCARILTANMEDHANTGKSCEIKTVTQAYSLDVIAAMGFGLDVNSLKDPDQPFVRMGKKAVDFSLFNPAILISVFVPFLIPVLKFFRIKLKFLPQDVVDFFSKVAEQAIEGRKTGDSTHVDFLQQMLDARGEGEVDEDLVTPTLTSRIDNIKPSVCDKTMQMSQPELLAQSILFFVAGFDTSASAMTYLCYHLAVDQRVQDKLYQEVQGFLQHKEELDYSDLADMPYMEQCINEAIRMYPSAPRVDRHCAQDVTIKGLHIRKGWTILFPVYAIHRDPQLWQDPDTFKPERFEDMSKIGNYFMPFGIGPRNCIGRRLALLEVKVAMAHLLTSYRLTRTPDTLFPMKLSPHLFMRPIKPIIIGLERRTLQRHL